MAERTEVARTDAGRTNTGRTDVEALIGSRFADPEVQSLLARYDAGAEVEEEDGKISWMSRPAGLELSVDAPTGRVTVVYAYGPAAKRHQPFGGDLPGAVAPGFTRDEVRARLGAPDKSGPSHDFWARDAYNISVSYAPTGAIKVFGLMG